MRPIKFRAWDKEENKMFEPTYRAYAGELEDLLISLKGDLILRKIDETIHESLFPNRFILMQSTGILDKNSVEIYEGDIVKHTDNFSNITTINKVYWKGGSLVFDVVVDEGLVYDVPLYKITEDNAEGYDDELEVLGNIYENPELLEGEE